jgi:hypothetical protein
MLGIPKKQFQKLTSEVRVGIDTTGAVRAFQGAVCLNVKRFTAFTVPGRVCKRATVYVAVTGSEVIHVGRSPDDCRRIAQGAQCGAPRYFEVSVE